MKIKGLLLASIIFTGCATQQHIECCDEQKDHQCDELYPYYNCPNPTPVYHYRDYKRTWTNSYTPGYSDYYPNTQTVYYVPVPHTVVVPQCDDNEPTTHRRPGRLGDYNPPKKPSRSSKGNRD